jgi:hypothetical protein
MKKLLMVLFVAMVTVAFESVAVGQQSSTYQQLKKEHEDQLRELGKKSKADRQKIVTEKKGLTDANKINLKNKEIGRSRYDERQKEIDADYGRKIDKLNKETLEKKRKIDNDFSDKGYKDLMKKEEAAKKKAADKAAKEKAAKESAAQTKNKQTPRK